MGVGFSKAWDLAFTFILFAIVTEIISVAFTVTAFQWVVLRLVSDRIIF